MAYREDICDGCGKIMRRDEPFREQRNGRERYCIPCNKKWSGFQVKAQPIYDEIDQLKEQKLAALKREHYGKPVEDNPAGNTYRPEEKKVSTAENLLGGGNAEV